MRYIYLHLLQHPSIDIVLQVVNGHLAANLFGDRRHNVDARNGRRAEGALGDESPRELGGWEQLPDGIEVLKNFNNSRTRRSTCAPVGFDVAVVTALKLAHHRYA